MSNDCSNNTNSSIWYQTARNGLSMGENAPQLTKDTRFLMFGLKGELNTTISTTKLIKQLIYYILNEAHFNYLTLF